MPLPPRIFGICLTLLIPSLLEAQSPAGFVADPSEVATVQGRPFRLRIDALDSSGARAAGFTNRVPVRAYRDRAPQLVLSEYAPGPGAVEICNTGSGRLDISGWELNALLNRNGEGIRSRVPSGTVLPPGGNLVWTGNPELFGLPNVLRSPVSLAYPISQIGALALHEPDGRISDALVMSFLRTPAWLTLWNGLAKETSLAAGSSVQRIGNRNRFQASDWSSAAHSIGQPNPGMPLPWSTFRNPEAIQTFELPFSDGVAVGDLAWSSGPGTFTLLVEFPPGLQRDIGRLSVHGLPPLRVRAESGTTGSETRPGRPLPCLVSLPSGFQGPAEIRLAASPVGEFAVPETILIPPGETEARFEATSLDDSSADGRALVHVTATAAGFADGRVSLTNDDDEAGQLFLDLPESVRENTGYQVAMGKVLVGTAAIHDMLVDLTTTPPLELPTTVVIPAGSRSVSFPVHVGDDGFYNRPLRAVVTTASAPGWPDATVSTSVVDDETPEFSLVLPDELVEGRTAAGTAVLRFPRDRPDTLRVTLRNTGGPSPAPVPVSPGVTNVTFQMELPEDSVVGLPRWIDVSARLDSGFGVDRNLPGADDDFLIVGISDVVPPAAVFSGTPFDLSLTLRTDGTPPSSLTTAASVSVSGTNLGNVVLRAPPVSLSGGRGTATMRLEGEGIGLTLEVSAAGFRSTSSTIDVVPGRTVEGPWSDLCSRPGTGTLLLLRQGAPNSMDALVEMDPATGQTLRELSLPEPARRIEADRAGDRAWIATASGSLIGVDLASWTARGRFDVASTTNGLRLAAFAVLSGSPTRILASVLPAELTPGSRGRLMLLGDDSTTLDVLELPFPEASVAFEVVPGRSSTEAFAVTLNRLLRVDTAADRVTLTAETEHFSATDASARMVVMDDGVYTGDGRRFSADTLSLQAIASSFLPWNRGRIAIPFPEIRALAYLDVFGIVSMLEAESLTLLGAHRVPSRGSASENLSRLVRCGPRRVAGLEAGGHFLRIWETPMADDSPADLGLTVEGPTATSDDPVNWTYSVTNRGPGTARQVRLKTSDQPDLELGDLAASTEWRGTRSRYFFGTPTIFRSQARVSTATPDPNPEDNTVQVETAVLASRPSWIRTVAMEAANLVASPDGQRLYAALPRAGLGHPAGVAVVDPELAVIESILPVPGTCLRVVPEPDGEHLWVQNNPERLVLWNRRTSAVETTLEPGFGRIHDFVLIPGTPPRIGVAAANGVALIAGNAVVASRNMTAATDGGAAIESGWFWVSRPGELYSFDVSADRLQPVGTTRPSFTPLDSYGLSSALGFLFMKGAVIDAESRNLRLRIPAGSLGMALSSDLVAEVASDGLRSHSVPDLAPVGEEPLPSDRASAAVEDPTRWGSDGVAYRDAASVVLFRTTLLAENLSDVSVGFESPDPGRPHDRFQIVLGVTNSGPSPTGPIRVSVGGDSQTPRLESNSPGLDRSGGRLYFSFQTLAPGESRRIVLWGTNTTASPTVDALVYGSFRDRNLSDNRSSVGFTPRFPPGDLAIRGIEGSAQVSLNEVFHLRIHLANGGASRAGNPRLLLNRPDGFRVERVEGGTLDEGCCPGGAGIRDLSPIGPGEETTVELGVRATRPGLLRFDFRVESELEESAPQDNGTPHLLHVSGGYPADASVVEFQTPGGGIAWVEARTNLVVTAPGSLFLLDPDTLAPARRIPVAGLDSEVVVTRDGRHAWVSVSGGNLAKVDLENGTEDYRFRSFSPYPAPNRGLFPMENAADTLVVAGQSVGAGVHLYVYDHGVPRRNHVEGMGSSYHVQILGLEQDRFLVLTDSQLREYRVGADGPELVRNLDSAWSPSAGSISRFGSLLSFGTGSGLDLSSEAPIPRLNAILLDPVSSLAYQIVPARDPVASFGIMALRLPDLLPEWVVDVPGSWNGEQRILPMGSRGLMVLGSTVQMIRPRTFSDRATALGITAASSGPALGTNQALTITLAVTNRSPWSFQGGRLVLEWSPGLEPVLPLARPGGNTSIPLGPFNGGTNLSIRILTRSEGPQSIRFHVESPIPDTGPGPREAEISFMVPPPPRLLLSDQTLVEGRFPSSPALEFVLDRPAPTNFVVTFEVEPMSADSRDVTSLRPTVTFAAGSRRSSMALVAGDIVPEVDETFRLRFVSGPVQPVADSILVTIANDDFPRLQVFPPRPREGDSGSANVTVTLALNQSAPFPTEVAYRLEGVEAEPGEDFLPGRGWLVFEPGRLTAEFGITIFGDRFFEADESLRIILESAGGLLPLEAASTVVIQNDDPLPAPVARILPASLGTGFVVSFDSVAGARYRLGYSTNLDAPQWIPIDPVVTGNGSPQTISVTESPHETRYFRLTVE